MSGCIIVALLSVACTQLSTDGTGAIAGLPGDSELSVQPDIHAPTENPAWVEHMQNKANYQVIRSLTATNFEDLQFLKSTLAGKRIIQLGESGHGVREFNMSKVRLIKFLHEEMGVNIVAFESPFFTSLLAGAAIDSGDITLTMKSGIFSVWHTEEVIELFRYFRQTQATSKPLRLVGFDAQISRIGFLDRNRSVFSHYLQRPALFRSVLTPIIGASSAEMIARADSSFLLQVALSNTPDAAAAGRVYIRNNHLALLQQYNDILRHISADVMRPRTGALSSVERERVIAAVEARNTIAFIQQITLDDGTDEGYNQSHEARDKAMAENVFTLANVLYPGEKIAIWAHNSHIRYKNDKAIHVEDPFPSYPRSMGTWLAAMFPNELYTVGFYMYRGQAAYNNRQVYSVTKVQAGSLESIAHRALKQMIFLDFTASSTRTTGNSWMFDRITAKDWGYDELYMNIREQYDGVLFIDTVNPPKYVP
jgi:erythromycin esterase